MSWATLVPRVHVDGALPVEMIVLEHDTRDVDVLFNMTVPCVNTGRDVIITMLRVAPPYTDEAHALAWLRSQVHWFYRHEADEQIRVDGVALFRPWHEHDGGK